MPLIKWTERTFTLDVVPELMPELLERWRDGPERIAARLARWPAEALTWSDGGWTIQQNIGHLIDLGYLPLKRLEQILAGETKLIGADINNPVTCAANHNQRSAAELLEEFRRDRDAAIARFEAVEPKDWSRSAIHPRLNQPMRAVDLVDFDCRHDDYHTCRMAEIARKFASRA